MQKFNFKLVSPFAHSILRITVTILISFDSPKSVNAEIFTQNIFARISHGSLDAQKYDVSEYINYYRLNGTNY